MPKSKRNKIVHLTQVKKKGKDHKGDLIKQLEENVAKFKRVFVFDFDSLKADRIMALRVKLKEFGHIFAGRNSFATLTLRNIGSRTSTDFGQLEEKIVGHRGLLFTDLERDKLVELLDKENQSEFLKRLIGFAKIAPEVTTMDVDVDNQGLSATKEKKKNKSKSKKSKQKATDEDQDDDEPITKHKIRQVNFVKI